MFCFISDTDSKALILAPIDSAKGTVWKGGYVSSPFSCRLWVLDILVIVRDRLKVEFVDYWDLWWSQYLAVVP